MIWLLLACAGTTDTEPTQTEAGCETPQGIAGTVYVQTEDFPEPAPDARLTATRGDDAIQARASDDGTFELVLDTGEWLLSATWEGCAGDEPLVAVEACTLAEADLTLDRCP